MQKHEKVGGVLESSPRGNALWLAAIVRPINPGLQFCADTLELAMACKACGSERQQELAGELTASFPGIKRANPPIYVSQHVVACLDCGFTALVLPKSELELLKKGRAASG
jgi:hypothetical protein